MWCRIDKNISQYPLKTRVHLAERMQLREFVLPMKEEFRLWLDTLPVAPDLEESPLGMGWKQPFESFTIYGEGKLVKTIGTIYHPISDRPLAIDLREWTLTQKYGRNEHIVAANEFLAGLHKRGYNEAYVAHTSGDSIYVALFPDPNSKQHKPGIVKLNGRYVQVLVMFSNDTSGIKEKDTLVEWKGEPMTAFLDRTMKWLKSLNRTSKRATIRKYYHISDTVNRASIKQKGLIADTDQGFDWLPHPKGVYLFKTEQQAINFAYDFWGDIDSGRGLDVWEVRVDSKILQVDDHPECPGALYCPTSIPPKIIKVVTYLTDSGVFQQEPSDEDGHLDEDDVEYTDDLTDNSLIS